MVYSTIIRRSVRCGDFFGTALFNFGKIFPKFDICPLALAVSQLGLQRLADCHAFGRRQVLPDLVLGKLPSRDAADKDDPDWNGLSTEDIRESLQPAFAEDEDVLLGDSDGLEKAFGGNAGSQALKVAQVFPVPIPERWHANAAGRSCTACTDRL